MTLEIRLLGQLEVRLDGQLLVIERSQVRHVLSVLASSCGRWVPLYVLEADLWPDRLPNSPRSAVQVIIARLRMNLADEDGDVVESGDSAYRLNSDACDVDVSRWTAIIEAALADPSAADVDRLAEARDLWRGAPFQAFESELLTAERERLVMLEVEATVLRARLLLGGGRPGDALRLVSDLVAREPLREDVVIIEIEALAACGRPADAMRSAASFRTRLREELGLSPSARFDRVEGGLAEPDRVSKTASLDLNAASSTIELRTPISTVRDRSGQPDELRPDHANPRSATDGAVKRLEQSLHGAMADDRPSIALELARSLEAAGERDRANDLYEDVVSSTDDIDLLADAALGGISHGSRLGGLPARRRRLAGVRRRLTPGGRRDEVTAELALEILHARRPLGLDILDELRTIGDTFESSGRVPASRVLLVLDEQGAGGALTDAARLIELAFADAPPAQQSAALIVAVHVAMTAGAWFEAEQWIEELRLVARASGEHRARWIAQIYSASLADATGQHDEADETALRAHDDGIAHGISDAGQAYALLHLGRAFRSGSIAAFAGPMEEATARYQFPVWFALRGIAELDSGREGVARDLLRLSMASLEDAPDTFRPPALVLAALLAARLDDIVSAAKLAPALAKRAGRLVFLGYGGPFLGPVDWFGAQAASAIGEPSSAQQLEDDAVALVRSLGARGWPLSGLS